MRPQQQNRRMRGRNNNNNNNNRKGPNPLTRSYESNGPDVKIRGSAQQIAEKYTTLARDAMSSGDRVMAENYLQHAEHYNRIIAAAQAQMPIQHQGNGPREDADEDLDDERDEFDGIGLPQGGYGGQDRNQGRQGGGQNYNQGGQNNGGNGYGNNQQYRANNGGGNAGGVPERGNGGAPVNHAEAPQPVIEGMPAEIALNGEGGERQGRGEGRAEGRGEGRGDFRDRRDRKRRFDNREDRGNEAGDQPQAQAQARAAEQPELPAFVTAPIARREVAPEDVAPAAQAAGGAAEPSEETAAIAQAEGEGAPRRGRRPRRSTRSQGDEAVQAGEAEREPSVVPAEG